METYKEKDLSYFTNIRHDLIRLIPKPTGRLLEVGAGGGDTLTTIKEQGVAREVYGLELNPLSGSNQSNPLIDRFIFGNIETMDLPFSPEYFDVIVCGDVLEHLIDPWQVVNKLQIHLKRGGVLIASIPNVQYFKVTQKIIAGDFRYTDYGLFDKTHLRFFCKKNMIELLTTKELKVESVVPIFDLLPPTKIKRLNQISFRLFQNFLTMQYVLIAKKSI